MQVVREAIQALPLSASGLTVYLSDQDFQALTQREDLPEHWHLQIDRTLTPGGCRITTAQSVVDYTLEDQFQQLVNAIVEKRFAELAASASSRPDARD